MSIYCTTPYINIHTHQQNVLDKEISIYNVFAKDIFSFNFDKEIKTSIGLHPWHINSETRKKELQIIEQYATKKNVLAIGEIGLDKNIETSYRLQKEIFIEQLKIASLVKKPVIIHCVKAYQDLIEIKKKWDCNIPWIFHGFNSSIQIAEELIKINCYLSFGHLLLKQNSAAFKVFPKIPDKYIFLENDESSYSIEEIYSKVAEIKAVKTDTLKNIIYKNYCNIF